MAPVDLRNRLRSKSRNQSNSGPRDTNIKDLRTLIVKKSKSKGGNSSTNKVSGGRIVKHSARAGPTGTSRDLRDSNRKLASRGSQQQQQTTRSIVSKVNRNDRLVSKSIQVVDKQAPVVNRRTISDGQVVRIGRKVVQQQQYYVPPHMQRNQATYIIAPATHKASSAMEGVQESQSGASVLVSNLTPTITQSDIIELFGDIGVMTAVNMINPTTALVTYQHSSDAVRSVKVYHNRLLDGSPMLVNMMPNSV